MAKEKKRVWKWWAVGGSLLFLGFLNRQRIMADLNIQLTPNFNLQEFIVTATGLDNIPGPVEIMNIQLLCVNVLQPLHYAVQKRYPGQKVAIKISSGFRSLLVNKAIGGSATSQHKNGQAADFSVFVDGVRLSNQEVINIIREAKIPYDQVIDEQLAGKHWIHVSFDRSKQRLQWLTARDSATGGTSYQTVRYG